MVDSSPDHSDSNHAIKYRNDYQVPAFLIEKVQLDFHVFEHETIVFSEMSIKKNDAYLDANEDHGNVDNKEKRGRKERELKERCLILNGENLRLINIKLDGVPLPRSSYKLDERLLSITDLPDEFTLEIETEIFPSKNTLLEGLFKTGSKLCTQCEAEGFRNMTYYPDRPDVMATFTTRIEADKTAYPFLLSNGNLIDSGDLNKGRHYTIWHDPFPKPCYLFALVAGDFDLLEDTFITVSGKEVALKIYVDRGKLNQCHHAMASLKRAMKWDEDVFGLEYDLDIYMIVAVSDFNMGAMENKGLNIFNTCYVLANDKTATDDDFEGVESVIGHEYFHNWTGNRVTCRDWFQLSLKEGLTVFRDQEFSSDMNSRAVKRVEDVQAIKNQQFAEDAGPMAHPIRPDSYIEMNNFYTHTVYNKGAEVIRMMQTILGEKGFQLGMKLYFQRHDGQAVTCEDFIMAMEDANSVDFTLFRNWYSQAGTPEVEVTSSWDSASGTFSLNFHQTCSDTPGQTHKEAYLIPLRLALYSDSGEMLDINIEAPEDFSSYQISNSTKEVVLELSQQHQTVVFNLKSNKETIGLKPIPSLLRGFSAPVKLNYDYTDLELSLLLAHDNDSYTNWNAGQTLMSKVIHSMTESLVNSQQASIPDILIAAVAKALTTSDKDPSLLAMSIKPPGLDVLVEQYEQIPFDELQSAYHIFNQSLAQKLKSELLSCFHKSVANAHTHQVEASGWRRLQNACLQLLAYTGDDDVAALAFEQFISAKGMTNTLSALKALVHGNSRYKDEVLSRFYQQWQNEPLVLDKWFSVQAINPCASTIEDIEQLLEHADFQLSNPNKVRSLITAFAKNNLYNFHRIDGKGYQLVADIIIKLNNINPQIAARLTSSFNRWRHFDPQRKSMMESQLKRVLETEHVSKDVYEIASKALL